MSKTIAVILSGCGYLDGAEITESISTLIALSQAGANVQCFAPNHEQMHVVDHITGEETPGQVRNIMVESARICRGEISPLSTYNPDNFDALIIPGGFGVAKNTCDFAIKGTDMTVQEDMEKAIISTHKAKKPIGALCIAPVLLAKLVKNAKVTIGSDPDISNAIKTFGAAHETTTHEEIIIDQDNKLVTTPCYMLDASPAQIFAGATNCVQALLQMT